MFVIKNVDAKKLQKKKIKRIALTNNCLVFGTYGLKIVENNFITIKQLNMIHLILSKNTKKIGKFWIKVFPHFSTTSKPLEVRMGKGKGYIDTWISKLKSGSVLLELRGLSEKQSLLILNSLRVKLPFKSIIVKKKLDIIE